MGPWLDEQRFYRLNMSAPELDAPEFRIAEDTRIATEPVIDFGYGIGSALLTAAAFFSVLWSAGGTAIFLGWEIPGFLAIAAIPYAIVVSTFAVVFGRPLITSIEQRGAAEAKLRGEMGRRRDAESIAIIGGARDEVRRIGVTLSDVIDAWISTVGRQARVTLLMSGNGVLTPVLPPLLCAPNYLNGSISLGELMQAAAAFVQVQTPLNWLVDNYPRITEWLASAGRVATLWSAFTDLDASLGDTEENCITIEQSPDENVYLEGLSVARHNGRVVIGDADAVIRRGEKVLLTGESGTGKSTLVRAVAGIWPWGSGRILLPASARILFLPQRPYMPEAKLRDVLTYPECRPNEDDARLRDALASCGLRRLSSRLEDSTRWDKELSGGEQQRLAFARILVLRPDIVIMDEATSALDAAGQDAVMALFRSELADTTVISVGHRPELEEYHERKLTLHQRAVAS